MGLANMRERAMEFGGELDLQTEPDRGTSLIFSVPCIMDDSSRYHRRMFMWAFQLCIMGLFLLTNSSYSIAVSAFTAVAMIGFVREALAWRRSRKGVRRA
jgi:hypothetical protein